MGRCQTVYDYDKMNIWSVGGLYRFDNNWGLLGQYAVNTESDNSDDKQAYMAELQYKNANIADPGSWGAYVAYRHFVDILPMPKGRGFLDTNDTCLLK